MVRNFDFPFPPDPAPINLSRRLNARRLPSVYAGCRPKSPPPVLNHDEISKGNVSHPKNTLSFRIRDLNAYLVRSPAVDLHASGRSK